jgi:Family of unknown function (DUF5681)
MENQLPARRPNPIKGNRPWPKGTSGNILGRKKDPPEIKELLVAALAKQRGGVDAARRIINVVIRKALAGDLKAIEMLWDRRWGKPKQSMEIEGTMQSLNIHVAVEQRDQIIQSFKNDY